MTEQLTQTPIDGPDSQNDGWQKVALEMHAWHPDLRAHAERHLAELGITPEIPEAVAETDQIAVDEAEKDRAIDAHNDFNNMMPALISVSRRLDLGKDVRGNDRNSKEFIDGYVEKYYNTVRDAAVLPIPEDWVHVYGENIPKIAGMFGDLARSYKLALRSGVYTSYTSRRLTDYDSATGSMPNSNDVRRIPVPILGDELDRLSQAPEEERLIAVAELLDHARYRHDVDADPELLKAQTQEQEVILQILDTLPNDYRKDLLAADAVSHFLHRRINRPDLASRSLDMISVPELREHLSEFLLQLEESSPENIVALAHESSMSELERITSAAGYFDGQLDELMQEARKIEPQAKVVVNMHTENLINFLFETFRMLPVYETGKSSIRYMAQWDRIHDEEQLGLHGEHDLLQERPIYGTLVLGDAERSVGSEPDIYGGSVVEIKPEVARERTTYTYGDSLNSRRLSANENMAKPVDFEAGLAEKIIFDRVHPNPSLKNDLREPYIEAQILGGVGVEDIASITLPFEDVASLNNQQARFRVLRAILQDYPSLKCKVVIKPEMYEKLSTEARATYTEAGIELVVV